MNKMKTHKKYVSRTLYLCLFLISALKLPIANSQEVRLNSIYPSQESQQTRGTEPVTMGPSAEQENAIYEHNESLRQTHKRSHTKLFYSANARPFAEYEENRFLIFSAETAFESAEAKIAMAKYLPQNVTLIIYTNSSSNTEKERILNAYSGVLPVDRIKIISIADSHPSFWARDGIPVPVVFDGTSSLRLVDAKYYHKFEPDQEFAKIFGAQLVFHDFYYEGGNFMPNRLGDCLTVERTSLPTDDIFKNLYGCKRIIRLPFVKGIGHVDESAKFLSDKAVVTDTPQYAEILKNAGFDVYMLPRPDFGFETYVNSLLINGVLYLPIFGEVNDALAISTYESFGLRVIPIRSNSLSNIGKGSLHCITMNYPKTDLNTLIQAMGGKLL